MKENSKWRTTQKRDRIDEPQEAIFDIIFTAQTCLLT